MADSTENLKDDEFKAEMQKNGAQALQRIAAARGIEEPGPFEITIRVTDKKSKRSAQVIALMDIPSLVHYREDKMSLRVEIPVGAIDRVSLKTPD